MRRILKVICFIICAPILLSSLLIGCTGTQQSTGGGIDSESSNTTDMSNNENDDNTDDTAPEPNYPIREINEAIISSFDFRGTDTEEMLSDKSNAGKSAEIIQLSGSGATVSAGKLKIEDGPGNFATISCPQGSDLYSLANKTIVFKAKISNDLNNGYTNSVAGILSKNSTYDLYFSGANDGRAVNLRYNVGGAAVIEQGSSSTTVDEYRVFAITTEIDYTNGTGFIRVYRSTIAEPESYKDFKEVLTVALENLDTTFATGNDALYLGKRSDHTDAYRTLVSEFAGIKVYDMVLNIAELATVSFDGDAESLLRELKELISIAETVEKGVHGDIEWNAFTSAISNAKALDKNSGSKVILDAVNQLSTMIKLMEIHPIPSSIGGMNKISFNNPDLTVPIYVGLRSSPGFYDIDGDGKNELVVAGYGRSYSGVAGGSITAFRNISTQSGATTLGNAEILFSGTNFPIYSYKKDGSAVFVTTDGVMYTEISNIGYGEGRTYSKLKGYFKLYDVDGDGKSDAVYVSNSAEGTNTYDENGNCLITYTAKMYWLKNTGSEENPLFAGSPIPFSDNTGNQFTVTDPTQYAYISSYCMYDWDGDGDLDLIAGGWKNEFYYYENVGTSKNPIFKSKGIKIETESGPMQLDCCRYNAVNYDWDGDGKDDLILGGDIGEVLYRALQGWKYISCNGTQFSA